MVYYSAIYKNVLLAGLRNDNSGSDAQANALPAFCTAQPMDTKLMAGCRDRSGSCCDRGCGSSKTQGFKVPSRRVSRFSMSGMIS